MCIIAARPPTVDTIPQDSRVTQFNTWLFNDYKQFNCQNTLKVTTLALLILSVVGYFFVIGAYALMDWYEKRQTIVAFNEELRRAFGTNDIPAIHSRLQNEMQTLDPSFLELGLHAVLASSLISFQQKFELSKEAERLFRNHNYTQQREFFIPIPVAGNTVEVPFSLLETSSVLKDQLMSDDGEVDAETAPVILESRHFSLEDFQQCLPLLTRSANLSFNHFGPWLKTLAVAHLLDCNAEVMKKIAEARPPIPTLGPEELLYPHEEIFNLVKIEHIREILRCNLPNDAIEAFVAPLVADYIRVEFVIHHKSTTTICNTLRSTPEFLELARHLPIELNLSYINDIDQQDLDTLIDLFPRIQGLDLSDAREHLIVPSHIISNLRKLELGDSNVFVTFPEVDSLPRLEILSLNHASGFNMRCPNLKSASMRLDRLLGAAPPPDLFDNLPHLESLKLWTWNMNANLRAPTNCPKLKKISLVGANIDLQPLSGHQSIESIEAMYFNLVIRIEASGCPNLREYSVGAH